MPHSTPGSRVDGANAGATELGEGGQGAVPHFVGYPVVSGRRMSRTVREEKVGESMKDSVSRLGPKRLRVRGACCLAALWLGMGVVACEEAVDVAPTEPPLVDARPSLQDVVVASDRQLIYVPAYTYALDKVGPVHLTTTLLIHNVSLESVTIHSVRYYDSAGGLVDNKIEAPRVLAPLETVEFRHDPASDAGGAGANFLVAWSGRPEPAPLVEALMAGNQGGGRLTFSARGVPVGIDHTTTE